MLYRAIASVAVLISLLGERAPAQTLSLLPAIVAEEIRAMEQQDQCRPKNGVEKAVHRRSMFYIIDEGEFVCGPHQSPGRCGSGGCGLQVFVNAGADKWVKAKELLVFGWNTVHRDGRTLLQIRHDGQSCGGQWKSPPCVTTYRATQGRLVEVGRRLAPR
jgi:hypothetical protein